MDYSNEPAGTFFFIDNKSFYASCESVARNIDPLKSIIVVMSEQENTNGGLILAASPRAKEEFHIKNVSRQRDIPRDPQIMVVPPRMNLYIRKNLEINAIFQQYVQEEDLLPYSIDESLLDMTKSWHLFGESPQEVATKIQHRIKKELGLYVTVGIGQNPVQAKLALDLFAKQSPDLTGELSYETFADKVWPIENLTDIWSIGSRTAKRLNRLKIFSMHDLAHYNPYLLKKEFGIIGFQLYALAWGIDRSKLTENIKPKDLRFSNSQVLPRDYTTAEEIKVVIREIGEQVATRVRAHKRMAGTVSLSIGFAYAETESGRSGFSHSCKIEPTNDNKEIADQLVFMFDKYYEGESVRNVAVSLGDLRIDNHQQLNLFESAPKQIKHSQVNKTLDEIRKKYGTTAIVKASSLMKGATAMDRVNLVGGHNGGNAYD